MATDHFAPIAREAFLALAPFATEVDAYENYLATLDEGPYCSICDGLGHTICPLEERGARNEPTESELYFMGRWA